MGWNACAGVRYPLYKDALALCDVIHIWKAVFRRIRRLFAEKDMGFTGSYLISLLLYISVINEIRWPTVSLFYKFYYHNFFFYFKFNICEKLYIICHSFIHNLKFYKIVVTFSSCTEILDQFIIDFPITNFAL